MCTVSMVMQGWTDQFPNRYPGWTEITVPHSIPPVSRAEFEALKAEMDELKRLILAAKKFDEATGQPHCETEEKTAFVKKMADLLGVDMKDALA